MKIKTLEIKMGPCSFVEGRTAVQIRVRLDDAPEVGWTELFDQHDFESRFERWMRYVTEDISRRLKDGN